MKDVKSRCYFQEVGELFYETFFYLLNIAFKKHKLNRNYEPLISNYKKIPLSYGSLGCCISSSILLNFNIFEFSGCNEACELKPDAKQTTIHVKRSV